MKPIKLLFYLPNIKSYLDRINLLEHIAKDTDDLILVVSKIDYDLSSLNIKNLKIFEIPKNYKKYNNVFINASLFVSSLLKKHKINIVHDTFGHLLLLFLFKWKFPNIIFITSIFNHSAWDYYKFFKPNYSFTQFLKYKDLRYIFFRVPLQKLICRLADKVIVQAPKLTYRLYEMYPFCKNKSFHIPNNINFENWNTLNKFLKKEHSLTLQLIFVGGFSISKGCDRLIDIANFCKKNNLQVKITCVGGMAAVDKKFFEEKINTLKLKDYFIFLNRVEPHSLKKIYYNADWLFHFTKVDGSPRVVLEALSSGLPVIASKHPGIELFDEEGKFILYIDEMDNETLIKHLLEEKKDEEKHINRKKLGQDHIKNNFSSSLVARKYIENYNILLNS